MALLLCGCGAAPTTSLRLAVASKAPARAQVTIDDQVVGSLPFIVERGVAMPPGRHRISIACPGYLPWDAEVDAGPKGGLVRLDVQLVPLPD